MRGFSSDEEIWNRAQRDSNYVTIVDLLGQAGKFIKEIPMQPTTTVWEALPG